MGFSYLSYVSRIFFVALHIFIVITNILLYFWLIYKDFYPVPVALKVFGIVVFFIGLFIIFWGSYSLRKAVFVPENKLIVRGPFAYVRHPMYLGGIIGAFGLAVFAGSILGLVYSSFLAVVLSHIADSEEADLEAMFGQAYIEYKKKVPKLFPHP